MIEIQHNGATAHVLIHPNQSLTPLQFWLVFGALAFITLLLALLLAFLGLWLVAPVAVLHLGIVWAGFYYAWQRSERVEFLCFEGGRVVVGDSQAGPHSEFNRHWLRVVEQPGTSGEAPRVLLCSHGRTLEIGREIGAGERRCLMRLLQGFLQVEHGRDARRMLATMP